VTEALHDLSEAYRFLVGRWRSAQRKRLRAVIRRVAYVIRTFPRLSQTFVIQEIDWLLSGGVDVQIFCLNQSDEKMQHAVTRSARIRTRVHRLDHSSDAILARFNPDIIHAHFATDAASTALELGQRHSIPVTFTAHGYDIRSEPPADLPSRALRAAFVVTVSAANRSHMIDTLGVEANRIKLVPTGVDTEYFAPDPSRAKPSVSHVVCIARLEPVKQLHLLLSACDFLRSDGVPFRCSIIGDGSCRESLETLRDDLGLRDQVEFVGAAERDSVRRALQAAHLAVLSSQSEGYPVCLLEAAATGIPAVAPAVGGIPEIIVDGETGFLAQAADSISLGTALKQLCTDHRLASEMGRAARRLALRSFSIDSQMAVLLHLWEEAVQRTR
jgi:colanic acid/amylovoran biosynthesis glycosyltransferase